MFKRGSEQLHGKCSTLPDGKTKCTVSIGNNEASTILTMDPQTKSLRHSEIEYTTDDAKKRGELKALLLEDVKELRL